MSAEMKSAEDIMTSAMPLKSNKKYDVTWNQFCAYTNFICSEPTDEAFLQYFHFLKNERKLASSTLWSTYSMLNHKFQLLFGKKLQTYYRVTMLLKSFEAGYVRKKAQVFTKDEIKR